MAMSLWEPFRAAPWILLFISELFDSADRDSGSRRAEAIDFTAEQLGATARSVEQRWVRLLPSTGTVLAHRSRQRAQYREASERSSMKETCAAAAQAGQAQRRSW
jgi:hypothetical protein